MHSTVKMRMGNSDITKKRLDLCLFNLPINCIYDGPAYWRPIRQAECCCHPVAPIFIVCLTCTFASVILPVYKTSLWVVCFLILSRTKRRLFRIPPTRHSYCVGRGPRLIQYLRSKHFIFHLTAPCEGVPLIELLAPVC